MSSVFEINSFLIIERVTSKIFHHNKQPLPLAKTLIEYANNNPLNNLFLA